ncbi:tRNA dihydrouridine synthase DusB [Marinicella sp. S1101]|uniref:tRNA dihydrouridine synthase DusB n=1 Tax=Marinicella marina TaxID=2996016 RepID=UPI0022608BFE|nr:tRNA dihydrouridine synthase DusB [Marinicella marina]MCX7555005.1 tRNA dihydrouridine synthase DusB [Marinicella marina]MDJ1141331.1 tRNA dihydrouridine synthase DusB [Marinicella marina]
MSAFFIGPYAIPHPVILAPMAGVTDRPFRQLCRELGAAYAVSEMLSCDLSLLKTAKTQYRMNHDGEPGPIAVQIAGSDPGAMVKAAKHNIDNGAQIIDINMGCPQKKVARKNCGSALLAEPQLVAEICQRVVDAVDVPVTLKTRLGIDEAHKNIIEIAQIAESSGIQALFIHGRTKAQKYQGESTFDLIAEAKATINIPVIANGDIETPEQAKQVLSLTQCDGIMVGRAAQGNPWIFQQIKHFLATGQHLPSPKHKEVIKVMYEHINNLHGFYGPEIGLRIARKHIKWFLKNPALNLDMDNTTRSLMKINSAEEQLKFIDQNLLRRAA